MSRTASHKVLGPLLFLIYTADLYKIAKRLGVDAHFYADDSQTYVFSTPDTSESPDGHLLTCLHEMAAWLRANRLCLNPIRQSHSLCAALLHAVWSSSTTRRLPATLERCSYVRCLMIDFSKAFDRVDHPTLLAKLNKLDLPPHAINWIIGYRTSVVDHKYLSVRASYQPAQK